MTRPLLPLIVVTLALAVCGCGAPAQPAAQSERKPAPATEPKFPVAAEPAAASNTPSRPSRPKPPPVGQEPTAAATDQAGNEKKYVSFPAAGVKLIRPAGFDDGENFHGFQHAETQSSILTMKMPAPYAAISAGFSADGMKKRGMTLESKEDIQIEGTAGLLLGVSQSAYGIEFSKWIVIFGNGTESTMITATFPKSEAATMSSQLKAIVLAAKIDNSPAPAPEVEAGFKIAASDKLKLTNVGMGKMLLYTKDGTIPAKSPADPLFIAAPSLSKVPIEDKRQFAVRRLFQTGSTKISSIKSTDEVTIDGLDGYEMTADGEDGKTGTAVTVYQVLLFDDGAYFLMQGLVGAERAEDYLPEFKAMARSLKRD